MFDFQIIFDAQMVFDAQMMFNIKITKYESYDWCLNNVLCRDSCYENKAFMQYSQWGTLQSTIFIKTCTKSS